MSINPEQYKTLGECHDGTYANDWHRVQNERISHLSDEMMQLYTFGHNVVQNAEYEATEQEYLWAQHEKKEHDKCNPPQYGDHING